MTNENEKREWTLNFDKVAEKLKDEPSCVSKAYDLLLIKGYFHLGRFMRSLTKEECEQILELFAKRNKGDIDAAETLVLFTSLVLLADGQGPLSIEFLYKSERLLAGMVFARMMDINKESVTVNYDKFTFDSEIKDLVIKSKPTDPEVQHAK